MVNLSVSFLVEDNWWLLHLFKPKPGREIDFLINIIRKTFPIEVYSW